MGDRTQVGCRVDASLWQEFREDVAERKGQTRGVLGDELENAIRQYLYTGPEQTPADLMAEMNDRLQRVEKRVGTVESDGGSPTGSTASVNTHTSDLPSSTAERTADIADLARAENDREVIPVSRLRELIVERYGFGDRTVEKYVGRVADALDAERCGKVLAWGEYLTEQREKQREQAEESVDGSAAALQDAEVVRNE